MTSLVDTDAVGAPEPPDRRRGYAALPVLLWLGCGAGLLLWAALPATAAGPGSTRASSATADLLLSGTTERWAPRWLGVALYVPAVCGASIVALAGSTTRRGIRARIGALTLGLATAVAVLGSSWAAGAEGFGGGALSVAAGGAVAAVALPSGTARRRRVAVDIGSGQ